MHSLNTPWKGKSPMESTLAIFTDRRPSMEADQMLISQLIQVYYTKVGPVGGCTMP